MSDLDPLATAHVPETLDRATDLFEKSRFRDANALLLNLIDSGINTSYINFCIGRNLLYEGFLPGSRAWLERSLAFSDPFVWGYYELARLHEIEDDVVASAEKLAPFVSAINEKSSLSVLNALHRETLLRVAHRCFDLDRQPALELYREITRLGLRDYYCELRLVERYLDEQRISEAEAGMRDILTHHKLDPWGKLALSRLEFGKGDVAAATAAVVDAVRMQPDNAHLHLTAGHRLIEFGLIAEAEQICGRQLADPGGEHGLPDMEVEGLRFRLNLAKRDYAAIVEECRSQAFLRQLPDWLVVEALLKISAAGESPTDIENEIIDSFCGFLETRRPYALNIVVGLFQCYARQRRWEKIDALDAAIRSSSFYDHPDLLIRRFDILCARSRLDDARVLYLSHYANAKLRQWEACSVLRFLAESKLWDAAAELLFYFIESRFDFLGGEYFILRVCRRTNIHRAIISRIDASSGEHPPAQFAMLRDLLADDLAIRGASVLDSPGGGTPLAVSARNRILQSSVRSPPAQAAVGYLCADKAYFFSVLTFLASLAAQGGRGQTVAWYVFVAKDVPASWRQLLSQFAARIGLNVTSVPEADFVEGDAIHVEAYGIFTGGTTLSRAAFLRIYAARYLFNLGKVERAYYVDSDIIANSDFQKLMDVPFGDALILARAEEFNAEVRTVTEKHGLAERSYFNSGVLAFDFRKREILSHIDKAVMLSESETHRLVFHDQCALNIAFAGSVEYLGPEYNYFLRPHRKENGDFSEAVLIHFLDRPKPWDLSYSREYRSLWTQPAAIVRALVPPSDYGALVAAANQ